MNCPSRTDDDLDHPGWNQNPSPFAADLTTRQDLNGRVNSRTKLDTDCTLVDEAENAVDDCQGKDRSPPATSPTASCGDLPDQEPPTESRKPRTRRTGLFRLRDLPPWKAPTCLQRFGQILIKFGKFIGPGFMVAVAYIDPGNYSTDVAAGAATRFKLLFIVLMSNVFAILLQSLAVRLGTVTGLNLAESCRAHLPRWLNILLYLLGETAIIATDIAEVLLLRALHLIAMLTLLQVIGSAIALNLLFPIPLVAGCALTLVDVLIILLFYSPDGSMRRLRAFEFFVVALVLGVVICFCIQLSLIENTTVGEVFRGYLPSSTVVRGNGLYLSCGILGATVMPHSLYLGSGMVQARLRHFDVKAGTHVPNDVADQDAEKIPYRPSLAAIQACLTYSTVEVALSLFTFALFVNSAILIVSGASLSSIMSAQSADLFGIHGLLSETIAPAAGTIFALALLLSGTSAGIVCTIAGQMLSEGALNWTIAPWLRRLLTRSISITPSIIIAASVGKDGLSAALNATQVALSVVLPFVSAPLIYFTCRNKYMAVDKPEPAADDELEQDVETVKMRNHWLVSVLAVLVWIVIAIMNVALLVLVGLGKA